MAKVKVVYPDFQEYKNEGSFTIESDKEFNPYTWQPPIHWKGSFKGVDFEFTQISASGSLEMDYDFTKLPIEVEKYIPKIISAIDDAMRVMN